MSRLPVVVIVGRPNVGKSTLFNRLTRSRRALVHDLPGVTRDRVIGEAAWSGGEVTVVDTGGLLLDADDGYLPLIRSQAETAVRDADAVLLLLDGESGLLPEDRDLAGWVRTLGVPVVAVVNKADRRDAELQAHEFHALGLGEPVAISAEHGVGLAELWQALEPHLASRAEGEHEEEGEGARDEIAVAIVGRPNVGKSSLLNRLVGEPRVIVSEAAGTTRDAVDVICERDGLRCRFVDTAGIRRKGRTERGAEVLSVVVARRHLERADICLLLVDAGEGVTRQDAHVGGYAWEAGRATALVVNKWDLVEDRLRARERLEADIERHLRFLRGVPALYISALTGRGVHRLFPAIAELHEAWARRVSTSDLNRVLHEAWSRRPPPASGRAAPKLYYASQVGTAPPAFVLFTNLAAEPHFSYVRYLENIVRTSFGFAGVRVRVMIRGRRN